MNAIEHAVALPPDEVVVHRATRRKILRNIAPLTTGAQDVHQAVHHRTHVGAALAAARPRRRNEWRNNPPLLIRQVAWVSQMITIVSRPVFLCPHRRLSPTNQTTSFETQMIPMTPQVLRRTLSVSAMTPFPHPAHRTGLADLPHPALGQDFTPSLSRATPSAASEHLSELIGFPISMSFTTYCVCLELRSLPSTGVTRLQRYYEPLRHPKAPSLSLAGFRLVIADHAMGLPVLRTLSLCTCCRHYPGAAAGRTLRSASPSRISLPRKGCRVGLRIVLFEDCSAFTRVTACTLALSPYIVTR